MAVERMADGLLYSDSRDRLDIELIHRFLNAESYWVPGIDRDVVERALAHSHCFGVYRDGAQCAFARVVTDYAGFAYLADVFVVAAARGQGIGSALIDFVLAHPQLQRMRRFLLATRDAHALYARFGFEPLQAPERFMQRYDPGALSPSAT